LWGSFAKETYIFRDPTNRGQLIVTSVGKENLRKRETERRTRGEKKGIKIIFDKKKRRE